MINPINPGLVLPLYPNRLGNISTYNDGYGILASNTNFINWHFKSAGGAAGAFNTILATLVPVMGGEPYVIPDGAISSFKRGNDAYYFYNGTTLSPAITCGQYELKINHNDTEAWSDIIDVRDLSCGYQRAALYADNVVLPGGGIPFGSIIADDVAIGTITSSIFQVSENGGAYTVESLPFLPTGSNYTFIRTIITDCGADTATYSFDGVNLIQQGRSPSPNDVVWKLTVSYDQNSNEILYGEGYQQVFYFSGPLAGQDFEDNPERLSNGQGEQFLKYAETRDLITVTAADVSDAVLSGLYEGKHKTATLQRLGDPNALTTKGYEIAVSPAPFNHYNNVDLTFERAVYTTQFCEPDFVVTPL